MERARLKVFAFRSYAEIVGGQIADIVARMKSLAGHEQDQSAAAAIVGLEERPEIPLTKAIELLYDYSASELLGKREDQIRRRKNARKRAVEEFLAYLGGDKAIMTVSREDARKFRDLWLKRIKEEGFGRNAMNKQISHLSLLFSVLSEEKKLGLEPVFSHMGVSELERTRPPFERDFVEKAILAPVRSPASTPMRASRCSWVRRRSSPARRDDPSRCARALYLDRQPRGGDAEECRIPLRDIPLVGITLVALKLLPDGIARYHDKPATLSAVVNKFKRENSLLPSEKHTLYSFRHSFRDRLTEAEAPDRLQADLIGHKYLRRKYGKGPSLVQKQRWLREIAYLPTDGFGAGED